MRDPSLSPSPWKVGTLSYHAKGLALLFLLLLAGDFAWSLKERSAIPLFQILLGQVHVSSQVFGLLSGSIPALAVMLIGPITSVYSDRLRHPWGRRIPFLLIPTPLVVASMAGLAFSSAIGHWLALHLEGTQADTSRWILGVMVVSWTLFEVGTTISNAVFNGLINDVVPRPCIGRFFGLFRIVSLGAGVIFNFYLLDYAKDHAVEIFISIASIYAIGMFVMCRYVKEGSYPPPPPKAPHTGWTGVGIYFKECMAHGCYRWIFLAMALATTCFLPVNLFSMPTSQSFGMSLADFGKYNAIAYMISILLAYPLGWLTDRLHPVITGGVTLTIYTIAMAVSYLGMDSIESYSIALMIHAVLSGAFFTTTAGLTLQLFPTEKFTQFYSATFLLINLCQVIAGPLVGRLLDVSGHHYKLTYLFSAVIAAMGLVAWLQVYRQFRALGGTTHYRAPEV